MRHNQIVDLYAANQAEVSRLSSLRQITAPDIAGKHRHVQFAIACDHWPRCDNGARSVLLNAHPHVVSAARISAEDAKTAAVRS